jgi:hypothetical protein
MADRKRHAYVPTLATAESRDKGKDIMVKAVFKIYKPCCSL